MPTSNVTWTNNSTASNPVADNTSVERTAQLGFSHTNAMPSTVDSWQGSAAAGLDPSIANGSYADTGVTADTHVAYRITTSRSPGGVQEDVVSVPSGFDYVYDSASELGYPNGYPVTAASYNCSVEPQLHIDTGRIAGWEHSASERITGGLDSIIRHDQSGDWTIVPYSAVATAAPIAKQVYNMTSGNYRRTIGSLLSAGGLFYVKRPTGTPNLGFPDGVTVFRAVHCPDTTSGLYVDSGVSLVGSATTVSGISYSGSTLFLKGTTWGCTTHWAGVASSSISRTPPHWAIYAYRLNNTLTQYNTGTVKGQMLADGGGNIATGANVASSSYHDASGTKGAYGMAANTNVDLLVPGYGRAAGLGETLIFDEALDANDMNAVFGYLCNKFDTTLTPLSSGDLVG
jgi:hypothetical protein